MDEQQYKGLRGVLNISIIERNLLVEEIAIHHKYLKRLDKIINDLEDYLLSSKGNTSQEEPGRATLCSPAIF